MNFSGSDFSLIFEIAQSSGYNLNDIENVVYLCENLTNFTEAQRLLYLTAYFSYKKTDFLLNNGSNYMNLIFCLFGLIGYLIHFCVLSQREFQSNSFIYHRYIVIVELLSCLLGLIQSISSFIDASNVISILLSNIMVSLTNVLDMVSKTVALPMCFERIIALHKPALFERVNTRKIVTVSIAISTLTGILYLPDSLVYYLTSDNRVELSSFGSTAGYQQFLFAADIICDIRSGMLVIMSLIIIFGLLKVRENRKKLKATVTDQTVNISILTLSVAIPSFCNDTLFTIYKFGPFASSVDLQENLKLEIEQAIAGINSASIHSWLSFINCFLFLFCNCCHFYFYFLLSRSFRNGSFVLFGISLPETIVIPVSATRGSVIKPGTKAACTPIAN